MVKVKKEVKIPTPCGERLLVQRFKVENKSAGGILLPVEAQRTINQGLILAVGPKADSSFKIGQTILWSDFGATDIKLEGEQYVVLDDEAPLVIL